MEKAAQKVVDVKWYNAGQICLSADYVMCADSVKEKFLDAVKDKVAKTFGDKPKESPFYSRMINVNHFQ